METRTRGKGTRYHGHPKIHGNVRHTNPTMLSKQYYDGPLTTVMHGPLVLVYKTACVVKSSFTWISPLLLGLLPSIRCKEAKLQARIKPTALCSAIDKENSIEFPLDFLHYLYNYYMVCALFSHTYHVTHHVTSMWCDTVTSCHVTVTVWHLWRDTFPHFLLCSKSKIKEKKKKRKEI